MAQYILRALCRKRTFLLPLPSALTRPSSSIPLIPAKPLHKLNNPFSVPSQHRPPSSSSYSLCTVAATSTLNQEITSTPLTTNNKQNKRKKKKNDNKSRIDFTKIDAALLPTVILVGRPNVGKSALFNRLIGRREALVYNTPDDHVTRDFREGIGKLGDLRFRVLDSAGLETEATTGTILSRTTEMTANVLTRTHFAIFLIDVRDGLQPLDHDVGKWMRKHASGIHTIVVMNKSESLHELGVLTAEAGEAHSLGFGDPIAISAETGLGMADLYETLQPLFEEYVNQLPTGNLKLQRIIQEMLIDHRWQTKRHHQ